MSGFIQGEDRNQATLFPERIDEYITEENPVRVIDVFIDSLDISGLGFKVHASDTGRPGYHPSTMLKLYVYGYFNQVHSSRRLEREARRNVELMWLVKRLVPDFKTIADFRKDHGQAIRLVCREFVILCRKLNLLTDALVAIDGSKFKAINNRDRNYTRAKMKRRIGEVEASIDRYMDRLAQIDQREASKDSATHLEDKINALKQEMTRLKKLEVQMQQAADQQLSLTDPDARSMQSRGSGVVGYNVQTAVDATYHLIVAHEVNNHGSDRHQLSAMAKRAKATLNTTMLQVVADRGYYNGEEIRACEQANITAYLPKPNTSPNKAKGLYDRTDFRYIRNKDEYVCPANERLRYRYTNHEKGKEIRRYWSSACPTCSIKSNCTSGKQRRIGRWVHEEVLERAQAHMHQQPNMMRIRRATVEHPFGTIKAWMGATHFLTKKLEHVKTEMSLHVLAYNMKRMINIVGSRTLMQAIQA